MIKALEGFTKAPEGIKEPSHKPWRVLLWPSKALKGLIKAVNIIFQAIEGFLRSYGP